MQVPRIVRWPGRVKKGIRVNGLVDVGPDTAVTLLGCTGAEPFSKAHGVS